MSLEFAPKPPMIDGMFDGQGKHFQGVDTATGKQVVLHVPLAVREALNDDDLRMKALGAQKFRKLGGGVREVTLEMDDLKPAS